MSLIPLTVYDNLRRVCCSVFPSSSSCDHSAIAEHFIENASLADVIRWRRVSSTFKKVADRRLARYTQIHVRVHDGLTKIYANAANKAEYKGSADLNWHPTACLLLCEMSSTSLGIALDSKPNWKDIRTMLSLLEILRNSVEQVFMDSPVVEMLLKEVNNKNINALLYFLSQNRKVDDSTECTMHDYSIAPVYKQQFPGGPLFPKLKHFTVTSNAQQLSHLSRLIHYAVEVDLIYKKRDIDLVCLQVILGESWCKSKQRMFRHVNSFKRWSDASSLGVKYVQQFTGGEKKRVKNKY